jgi:hypothetical protein
MARRDRDAGAGMSLNSARDVVLGLPALTFPK